MSRRVSLCGIEQVNCDKLLNIMEVRGVFIPGWSRVLSFLGESQ